MFHTPWHPYTQHTSQNLRAHIPLQYTPHSIASNSPYYHTYPNQCITPSATTNTSKQPKSLCYMTLFFSKSNTQMSHTASYHQHSTHIPCHPPTPRSHTKCSHTPHNPMSHILGHQTYPSQEPTPHSTNPTIQRTQTPCLHTTPIPRTHTPFNTPMPSQQSSLPLDTPQPSPWILISH